MKTKYLYVVTIPWDSARVDETFIFECERDAKEFCDRKNKEGYHGYCGGLYVATCTVIKKAKTKFEIEMEAEMEAERAARIKRY